MSIFNDSLILSEYKKSFVPKSSIIKSGAMILSCLFKFSIFNNELNFAPPTPEEWYITPLFSMFTISKP